MKKLTIIAVLLLISITSSQMNCMDAWTDPYGLNDETQESLDVSNGIKVAVMVYALYNGKILLTRVIVDDKECWSPLIDYLKLGEFTKVIAQQIVRNQTGLDLYNIQPIPGFFESVNTSNHHIIIGFTGFVPTDKLTNNKYQWFNKNDIPQNLAPWIEKNFLYNILR